MNEQKSLLLEIAEAIDRRLRRRAPQEEGTQPVKRRPRWLRWLARQMVPNIGTLLMVVVLLLTIPSLAAPLLAPSATSTSTISYQGRLADSGGNPLTGKYNLEFRIYDVPTGGTPLWTEMWTGANAVDVSDGLFNVMLGSIDNTLASAIEGHDELYLGITVGTDSEMEPRVQLGSVPFSMQAMTVADGSVTTAKLADSAVTSVKIQDGQVGNADLANNAVSSAKIQDGAVSNVDLANNAVTSAKIADGAVTQADAPTLLRGQNNNSVVRWGNVVKTPNSNGDVTIFFPAFSNATDTFVAMNGDSGAGQLFAVHLHHSGMGKDYAHLHLSNLDGSPHTTLSRILFIAIGH